MTFAFIFPGQGSQHVGMGADLAKAYASARAVFEAVDDALGFALSKLMWEGPEDTLTLTENAQPALMAVSLAGVRVLEEDHGVKLSDTAGFVAGHSLGEYSALAASGALAIDDAARLLKTRGAAMQAAVPVGEGAMAALLGADLPDAERLAADVTEAGVCEAANDNAPGQVVLSGARAAVERAVEKAGDYGFRRAVLLPVSAPFHCALMQPAADVMAAALDNVAISAPAVPFVANVSAGPLSDPAAIRDSLVRQVTAMVRWRESIAYMVGNGATATLEIGAGRILTGLSRRIERSLDAISLGTPDDVERVVAALGA